MKQIGDDLKTAIQKQPQQRAVTTSKSSSAALVKISVAKAATMMGHKLEEFELNQWAELLSKWNPKEIEAAFMKHMAVSQYWAKPAEIVQILDGQKPPVSTRIDYTKPPSCAECNDLKFVYVPQGQSNVTAVKPCHACRKVSA